MYRTRDGVLPVPFFLLFGRVPSGRAICSMSSVRAGNPTRTSGHSTPIPHAPQGKIKPLNWNIIFFGLYYLSASTPSGHTCIRAHRKRFFSESRTDTRPWPKNPTQEPNSPVPPGPIPSMPLATAATPRRP